MDRRPPPAMVPLGRPAAGAMQGGGAGGGAGAGAPQPQPVGLVPLGANRGGKGPGGALAARPASSSSVFSRPPTARGPPPGVAQAQGPQQRDGTGEQQPMKEFVLRMAPAAEKWHVARFNVPVDVNQWKRPLRTYRADEIKPTAADSAAAGAGAGESAAATTATAAAGTGGRGARARGPFARPMYARNVKNIPLHLDDSTKDHAFIGRINKQAGGDSSNFFLLIPDVGAGEFKVIPTGDWYQFRAKRSFTPMTLEEAEEQLKQMEKQSGGRWATAGRRGGGKSEDKEDPEGREFGDDDRFSVFGESRADSDDEEKESKDGKTSKKVKDEDGVDEKEDIDFEEQWDDDEAADIEEPTEEKSERKGKMTSTGKQMKSLIKDLEGEEANIEESDEESEDELEMEKEEEEQGPKEKTGTKRKKGASSSPGPAASTSSTPPAKKAKIEPATPAPAAKPAEEPKKPKEPLKMSEDSVRQVLARRGHITSMQLISYFKAEITADPEKKHELTRIVKNVAKVVEIPPGSGKKFVTLRDDPSSK